MAIFSQTANPLVKVLFLTLYNLFRATVVVFVLYVDSRNAAEIVRRLP
jgi:hypothetical protein